MGKSIVEALRSAQADVAPVDVVRAGLRRSETISGYIVGVGNDWVIVAATAQVVYLDGWEVLRIRDITKVDTAGKKARRYIDRAIVALGTPPSRPASLTVSDGSPKNVLCGVLESAEFVAVHSEKKYPGAVWIGHFLGHRGKKFGLRCIDSTGIWEHDERVFALAEISRVTIGGRYNDALERFGDRRRE